ncbi:hypothetical protein [Hamadaea tsunoensis]|uniref:hypothetical protein n=1 Tax=Hamadaea tsunoensis TaxID=53368 RepID=UPI0004173555|nr:hypothetical protein [Hamadaea tsunoensis]
MRSLETADFIAVIPAVLSLFAFGAGAVVVLVLRSRVGGGASSLAAAGLGLLVLLSIWDVFWIIVGAPSIPEFMQNHHMSYSELNTLIAVITLVTGILHLIAVGLLLFAVFAGRRPKAAAPTAPLTPNPIQGYAPQPGFAPQPPQAYGQQPPSA